MEVILGEKQRERRVCKILKPKRQNSKTPKLQNSKMPKHQNAKTPKHQNAKSNLPMGPSGPSALLVSAGSRDYITYEMSY